MDRPRSGRGFRPKSKPKPKLPPEVFRKAKELNEKNGIRFDLAVKIAQGKETLSGALKQMMRDEKVGKLVSTHSLHRETASHVVDGKADLDWELLRLRARQTAKTGRDRLILAERCERQDPLCLWLDPDRVLTGLVTRVDKYRFEFLPEGGERLEEDKVVAHFAHDPQDGPRVKKAIRMDPEVVALALGPEHSPVKRIHFKHAIFQRLLESGEEFALTTRRGHILKGRLEWFGVYEFGLRLPSGPLVTIFRHALHYLDPRPPKVRAQR
jgi:hypothetical protein